MKEMIGLCLVIAMIAVSVFGSYALANSESTSDPQPFECPLIAYANGYDIYRCVDEEYNNVCYHSSSGMLMCKEY